jgi:hypothetical protein
VTERPGALFKERIAAVRALANARRNTVAKRVELDELERLEGAAYRLTVG